MATLVATRGGAPAAVGSCLAVNASMAIAGGLGAGCYESEIVAAALRTCADGVPRFLEIDLGSGDDPLSVSSGCGSVLEIAVWRPQPDDGSAFRAIACGASPATLAVPYLRHGEPALFEHVFPARSLLAIVGATPLSDEVAFFAARLDMRTVVVDPRPAYATRERLANAGEIAVAWPQDALPTVLSDGAPVVILSHDPKIDLPALHCALRSPSRYVALLGSRKSQALRRMQLAADGFGPQDIARIHGPAGLDLGGESVAETALSIVAQIVAESHGRAGNALRLSETPIHAAKAGEALVV